MIRKATMEDHPAVVRFMDTGFVSEGYGFVQSGQIETEIRRGSVFVYEIDSRIVGMRIGIKRLWNLYVLPEFRHRGIARKLITYHEPDWIRVKCDPIGHLNKQQREGFKDPRPFYEGLGYEECAEDYGRNFWQRGNGEAFFHKVGKKKHIKLYRNKRTTLL